MRTHDKTRRDAWKYRTGRRAFTLVEILIVVIILGILAAIAVPAFSNSTLEAKEKMLRENLRIWRTQLGSYRVQHRDISPGYPNGNPANAPTEQDFSDQMTLATDEFGDTTAVPALCGPYFRDIPENPINKNTDVQILDDNAAFPAAAVDNNIGWIYKPAENSIRANAVGADEEGTSYYDY